jgi:hypothetical protein
VKVDSPSSWSKTKLKSHCNFEKLPYVAPVFLPCVIYENVDIMFIEKHVYSIQVVQLKQVEGKNNKNA